MQCLIILPDDFTAPTELRLAQLTSEMTTSTISLHSITTSCFRTFFRRARYFAFGAWFVFPCSALGFFCFSGGLGEDTESRFLLISFFSAFLCINSTEVVASGGRHVFANITVPLRAGKADPLWIALY
jgi:hypothetical protein